MIVGFDATTLTGRISGVGYYTARLMESLANGSGEGIVRRLVVLSNRPVRVEETERVQVYVRRRFAVRSVWMQLVLPGILREVKPDLVHFTNYLAPLAGRVPYVVSFHDMTLAMFPQHHTLKKRLLTASLLPLVARRARLILTPSESTRRDVVRLLAPRRQEMLRPWLWLAPALALVLIFLLYPAMNTVWISFKDARSERFVGLLLRSDALANLGRHLRVGAIAVNLARANRPAPDVDLAL